MGPHISCLLKGIARWDSKLIKGDRQKGSRVSLFEGRQMGPCFSYWLKGIARWDSKLMEIARRDLVFRHLKVARWDLVFHIG
jgi:hypothetical protein